MRMSGSINELASALVKFQEKASGVIFDSYVTVRTKSGGKYSYKYATLGATIETAKALSELGIAFSQFPISEEGKIGVETILMHTSNQWISERFYLPRDFEASNIAQDAGSLITYARRYALQAILGLYGSEDVDARNLGDEEESHKKPPSEGKQGQKGQIPTQPKQKAQKGVKKAQNESPAPSKQDRPYNPAQLRDALKVMVTKVSNYPVSDKQRTFVAVLIGEVIPDINTRHLIQNYLFEKPSMKEVDSMMVRAALEWIDPQKVKGGKSIMGEVSYKELLGVKYFILSQQGQGQIPELKEEGYIEDRVEDSQSIY